MCRFVYYLGPKITLASLLTEPEHSLIRQSYHAREREEPLNGDGFGIGWYQPEIREAPVIFKEVNPAWNSLNLANLAPVASSHCILAHVRAASPGLAVTQLNCHPFSRGALCFMHNGEVGGFHQTRRTLLSKLSDRQFRQIESSGDSEVVFALVMDHLQADDGPITLERMGDALVAAINTVEEEAARIGATDPAYLNLVLTDGREAVISRYVTPGPHAAQSLYMHRGSRYECNEGICRMVDGGEGTERATIVSSEPLSVDPGWTKVAENSLLLIRADRTSSARRIQPIRHLG